jgi:hypothetical protein
MENSLEQEGLTERGTRLQTGLFWAAAVALTLAIYWICLRFLHPAYFAPLSPFHADFYDYSSVGATFLGVIRGYPRPVTFLGLKILGAGGLTALMASGVAIALIGVLLTLALARRMLQLDSPWLLASYAVYAFLLFAHPQFYIEHRHDLPAELSWLFLAISLLAWMSWVQSSKAAGSFAWLAAALLFAVLFAFAKEAYFVSALILVFGMAIVNRSERRQHLAFLAFLVLVEIASFAWTRHVNSPFVNVNADAASTYHISVAPGSVARTYWFYLSQLLNPFLIAIACLGLIAAWNQRRRFLLATALPLAGLAVFATLAVLPNHKFEEYAWSAAPLFLAPVLLLCKPGFSLGWKTAQLALLAVLSVLAVAGPAGYREQYATDASQWWVAQDQRGTAIWSSLDRLQAVPRPARILVSGLEDAAIPWEIQAFVQREFGDRIQWTVALPPGVQYRRSGPLVAFVNAADVRLSNFDYLATYHANGHLADIRPVKDIAASGDLAEVLLPDLAERMAAARRAPENDGPLLQCAELCINWGFWPEAGQFLAKAGDGAGCDATFQRLSSEFNNRPQEATGAGKIEFAAKPAHIVQPDHSGLGVTDLIWSAPAGVMTEIHVGAPNGALFAAGGNTGHAETQKWVKDGTQFFLQDVTGGKSRTSENTLAVVKVEVTDAAADSAQPSRAEFTANPAHIAQPDHSGLASTVLTWKAPAGVAVEVHICSPRGKLFASGGSTGRAATDKWVTNGMQFFLQDVTGGKPLTSENTLAVARVEVTP